MAKKSSLFTLTFIHTTIIIAIVVHINRKPCQGEAGHVRN